MKHAERVRQKIKSGEETEVQGLLEQWLREGRMTELEALLAATDMFTAGVDSVSIVVPTDLEIKYFMPGLFFVVVVFL